MGETKLKLFNGKSHGHKYKGHHVYVAAKSMAQAAKLISMACYDGRGDLVSVSEIKKYYGKNTWGVKMEGLVPTEPCVYMCNESHSQNKPFRVI